MPLTIVLDTNVLVSGLLSSRGIPGHIVDHVRIRQLRLAYDERIITEYRLVLARPRFAFRPEKVNVILRAIERFGQAVAPTPLTLPPDSLLDPDDLPFVEVASAARVDALVTGNLKHYAFLAALPGFPVPILSPADFYQRFISQG